MNRLGVPPTWPADAGGPLAPGWRGDRVAMPARGRAVKVAASAIAPLVLALAVLGAVGSFATVRDMAEPWFGQLAWIVPIGLDIGIFVLLAWDLLMEYLALPWPVLRWVAWAFIAGTVAVNVLAAGGDPAGVVMHAAMPVLFIVVVEGVRHLIRQWVGLATGRRIERIPAARWLLAPISTALLWRRMVLWHVTTYQRALDLEYRHLLAVSRLQQRHGRWTWRWRAPLDARLALRWLPAELTGRSTPLPSPMEAADDPERDPPYDHGEEDRAEPFDEELVETTRRILAEASRQGMRLNRTELGRRLRALGFSIANDRITELRAVAGGDHEQRPDQPTSQIPRTEQ